MRRNASKAGVCSALVLLFAVLAAAPAMGETVLGFFEGPLGGDNAASGAVTLTGWALADSPVRRVTIQVDGFDIGQANYALGRPDVEADNPGYPDSAFGGFGYNLNTTDFPNGLHTVSAKVLTTAGTSMVLPGTRQLFFNNNTHILKPFGDLNRPQRHAQLRGTCDLSNDNRRYTVIEGWALDLGIETGDTGVSWVELLLDGAIIASTRLGSPDPLGNNGEVDGVGVCHFDLDKGGLSNCYGFPRLDVERLYPFALDAPAAGFRFAIDVGQLIVRDLFPQGQHVIKARVGDISGQFADVDELPVTFFCIEDIPNEKGFGRIETPGPGRGYAGVITLRGWALDWEEVLAVQLYVDGVKIGNAEYGVDSRANVAMEFPSYPDSLLPGWRFTWDTRDVSDGFHQIQAIVADKAAGRALIGEVTFFVNNEIPD